MSVLIASATALEIQPLLDQMKKESSRFLGWDFDVLITGVGPASAMYSLTRQVALKKPDLVIQAGLAGSFDDKLVPGSVVFVKEDRFADIGVREKGGMKDLFELGLASPRQFPYQNGWLKNRYPKPKTSFKKWPTVRGITVHEISSSKKHIDILSEKYDPAIESMEGACLHYVCLMEEIPFMQIRAISNKIGVREKKRWNFTESIHQLNETLIQIIDLG